MNFKFVTCLSGDNSSSRVPLYAMLLVRFCLTVVSTSGQIINEGKLNQKENLVEAIIRHKLIRL